MRDKTKQLLGFLESNGPALYRLLSQITLSEDAAEELMQELFIKLNNSAAFEKAENPQAYTTRAALNLGFDWRQNRIREKQGLNGIQTTNTDNNSMLAKMIQHEQFEQVLDAIGRLKETYQQIIVMHHIQQNSYDQIAAAFNKDANQIRALCSKAIAQLREVLSSENLFSEKAVNDD